MASDYTRELLSGDDNSDSPSIGECLAEVREQIALIEAGDFSGVAPWASADDTLRHLREEEARYLTAEGA